MNWYKTSQKIDSNSDKNKLNQKIRDLQEISVALKELIDNILRNPYEAKKVIHKLISNKRLSSFPKIIKALDIAQIKILDAPKTSKVYLNEALESLYIKIKQLEKQREDFIRDRKINYV